MTDDLIERLRDYGDREDYEVHHDRIEAADRIEALTAEVERLRQAPPIPRDIAEQVMEMGRVEWGATAEQTAKQHIKGFANSLRLTREHFNYADIPVAMHGVYLAGTETILCHTGTSPNSGQNARILVGVWNRLYDEARAALAGDSHE